MNKSTIARAVAAVLAVAASTPAFAHIGVAGHIHGFADGLTHPISGLDHILVMVAVGMFAVNLGGRALWLVPTTFVLMMAAGSALGIYHVELPFVEITIAASVIVLGAAVALRLPLPAAAAMTVVGLFADFHGYAHGADMPVDASGAQFAAGFMIATVLLHIVGIGIGLGFVRTGGATSARLNQVGGTVMSLAGVGLLTSWL